MCFYFIVIQYGTVPLFKISINVTSVSLMAVGNQSAWRKEKKTSLKVKYTLDISQSTPT